MRAIYKHNLSSSALRLFVVLSVLLSFQLHAQQIPVGTLLSDYYVNAFQEKIFLHTNKSNFIAGETLYFKVYAVDGIDHKPVNLSRVCYVELLSQANYPIAQLKVSLENGKGNGSLDLPDTLNSGNYRIIGYTSWMKNFQPDYYYSQNITILNPLEPTNSLGESLPKAAIRFFPEGGTLVNGLESRVAFHAVGSDGLGIDFTGYLIDESNDTLATFKPGKHGLGSFSFTPQNGKSYRTEIRSDQGNFSQPLPKADASGLVMELTRSGDELMLNVKSNDAEMKAKDIVLFVHSRARGMKNLMARVNDSGEAAFRINKAELHEGITHFTLFDHKQRPRAERLYFNRPHDLLKIEAKQLSASISRRSPISLDISTHTAGNPVSANLSMSVFRIDELQKVQTENVVNYLLLTSDLKGEVEDPSYYFTGNEEERAKEVDHLMLTHGWSRFRWEDVLKSNYPAIRFNPDYEGQNVEVKITDENDAPIAKAFVFLSVPSKITQLYSAQSNVNGILNFRAKEISGKSEIVLQHLGQTQQKYVYSLISPFTKTYPASPLQPLKLAEKTEDLIHTYSVHQQVASTFNPPASYRRTNNPSLSVFGHADKTYIMSDYVKFPVLEDVLREYVVEVIVRRREKKTSMYVLDKENQIFFESDPLILVDGVPVFDTERIIRLQAQYFEKVDIVMEKFYFGIFSFTGIVSFTTSDGLSNGTKVNPEAVVLDYDGLVMPREFYQPVYNGVVAASKRHPDFRNVLLWKPDVSTDNDGSTNVDFFTSDLTGKYIGVIQGITSDGRPGSTTFTFEVGNVK